MNPQVPKTPRTSLCKTRYSQGVNKSTKPVSDLTTFPLQDVNDIWDL